MKNIWIVSLVAITTVLFSCCNEEKTSTEKKENTIVGKWENKENHSGIELTKDDYFYTVIHGERLDFGEDNMKYEYSKISDDFFEINIFDPKILIKQKLRISFVNPDKIHVSVLDNDSKKLSEIEFVRVNAFSKE